MKNFEFAFTLNAMMKGNVVADAFKALENMNKAIGQLKYKYNDIIFAQNSVENALKKLDAEYRAGAIDTHTYNVKHKELQQQLEATKLRAQGLAQNMRAVSKEMQQYQAMNKFATARGAFNASMQNAVGAYATFEGAKRVAEVLTAPIMDGVRAAMTFESAMADVRKVVDFDTPQGFKNMQQDILKLSTVLPMIPEDIAKIVAAGGQAGIAKDDLLIFAESAAKMGVAFDISADQAGDMMAKWRTAFKMNQQDVVALADKINYLGNTTAAAAPLISDVVTRIGPLGEVGGVASGEIAALGASMVGAGIQSEVAATGIKNLILNMVVGENASKKQAEAFASLGMNAGEMAKRMQTDAKGAIMDVLQAIKELDADKQASTLKTLFGQESIGAISPLLSNLDNLKENFDKVADSSQYAGSMEAEYAERSKTAENAMILMENSMKKVNIQLGNIFLPMVANGMQLISEFAVSLAQFIEKHETLATILGGAAISASALAVGFTALGLGFAGIKTAYTGLFFLKEAILGVNIITKITTISTKAFQAAQAMARLSMIGFSVASTVARTAMLSLNAAMVANPAGLVVVGIIALVAAGAYLVSRFTSVRDFMVAMWESPTAATIAFLTGWLVYAGAGIVAHWEDVKAWFTTLWDNPSEAVDQFVAFFTRKLQALWETAQEYWGKITAVFGSGPSSGGPASMAPVAHNAAGGIYGKGAFLTTFAEESPEAAIPLDGSRRAISLWQQAGQILGMLPDGSEGGSSTQNISISIPVTVNGTADGAAISSMQSSIEAAVRRALADIRHQEGRVSFA